PPPYNTQCHNYERYGYSSSENCFSECLTNFTKTHGMMIESNVIERGKYEKSSLSLAPWHLRSLRENGKEITASDIKDNRLLTLFPNFKRRWKKCKETCRFRECHIEAFSPYSSDVERRMRWYKINEILVETDIS